MLSRKRLQGILLAGSSQPAMAWAIPGLGWLFPASRINGNKNWTKYRGTFSGITIVHYWSFHTLTVCRTNVL